MVGDGPMLPNLKTLAKTLNLDKHVTFPGHLEPDRLAERVCQSWANIHCSQSEGWCFSAMEACAGGTPTAAYSVPGLTESVQNGTTGILVRDGDLAALSLAIEKLSEDSNSWTTKCRSNAELFSWETTSDKWETHLRKVSS
jgi:glycosyltransferase involved in cell wall biosynthesis